MSKSLKNKIIVSTILSKNQLIASITHSNPTKLFDLDNTEDFFSGSSVLTIPTNTGVSWTFMINFFDNFGNVKHYS